MFLLLRVRLNWGVLTDIVILVGLVLLPGHKAAADVFDWDNWTGDKQFASVNNWVPTSGAPPGVGDTAIFLLANSSVPVLMIRRTQSSRSSHVYFPTQSNGVRHPTGVS